MSKKIVSKLILFVLLLSSGLYAQENTYRFSINLNEVKDDKLTIELLTPTINSNEIIYRIPKVIPGTYTISDYGRYISDFKVYEKAGKEMKVEFIDANSWKIADAKNMYRITYKVEDTYDTRISGKKPYPMAGTNIDEGKNFVINTFGYFGYFDGMLDYEYDVVIKKPSGFYGSTALNVIEGEAEDTYKITSYYLLADSPIMYCKPDTTIINIEDTQVLISVYNQNESSSLNSKYIARTLAPTLNAIKNYLGGKLPIEKYAFIYYFESLKNIFSTFSFVAGALEHSRSSFYYLFDTDTTMALEFIPSTSAHEFFHVITPLSIHSEEIAFFDFHDPKMSKHLWLYEGVTEYQSMIARVKYNDITRDDFLKNLGNKIQTASGYDDNLPFTDMSKDVLTKYQKEYNNVYEKGALIGASLDILLRKYSDGKYGIVNLLNDLSNRFGKEKPFKDEELFDVIRELTYPEIGDFLANYVEGIKSIPYDEIFGYAGVSSGLEENKKSNWNNMFMPKFDSTLNRIKVGKIFNTELANKIGLKEGDVILEFNGKDVNIDNFISVFLSEFITIKEGDEITMVVLREDNGKKATIKIKDKYELQKSKTISKTLKFIENPSEEQVKIREAWLGVN